MKISIFITWIILWWSQVSQSLVAYNCQSLSHISRLKRTGRIASPPPPPMDGMLVSIADHSPLQFPWVDRGTVLKIAPCHTQIIKLPWSALSISLTSLCFLKPLAFLSIHSHEILNVQSCELGHDELFVSVNASYTLVKVLNDVLEWPWRNTQWEI